MTHDDGFVLKSGLAQMLKGGVIMDVTNAEQARIAEEAGAVAVMALDRIPADIRQEGGVARMADPAVIAAIQASVSIPVMAKCRIGHTTEAQILQQLEVDFIDESEVLTPADTLEHVQKHALQTPFVCGCRDLGEALRRVEEGAAMIRTKGEAGTGNVQHAVYHAKLVHQQIQQLREQLASLLPQSEDKGIVGKVAGELDLETLEGTELQLIAKEMRVKPKTLWNTLRLGRLPVFTFAAGGIATPADAALMMSLGMDGVFVGSGIFKSSDPSKRARAMVQATAHWKDPDVLAKVSTDLGPAMVGISKPADSFASRGL